MPWTLWRDAPFSALGVARVLVHAGKLNAKTAEDLVRSAKDKRSSFVSSVIAAGRGLAGRPGAHPVHRAGAAAAGPVAIDVQRLPRGVIDAKLAAQYQILVLGKRGNRLFIGGADPTDQEAVERIKFATQLSPEWVIVEHDKLIRMLEAQAPAPARRWRH